MYRTERTECPTLHLANTKASAGSSGNYIITVAALNPLHISSQYCRWGLWCWPNVPKFKDEGGLGWMFLTLYRFITQWLQSSLTRLPQPAPLYKSIICILYMYCIMYMYTVLWSYRLFWLYIFYGHFDGFSSPAWFRQLSGRAGQWGALHRGEPRHLLPGPLHCRPGAWQHDQP